MMLISLDTMTSLHTFFFLKGAYRLDKEYVARRHHGLLVLTILDDTEEIFLAPYSACFMKGGASKMII